MSTPQSWPTNWRVRHGSIISTQGIVFDVDGVLADASHRLSLVQGKNRDFDAFFEACELDEVIESYAILASLIDRETTVCLVTARPISVLDKTLSWLELKDIRWDVLIMRPSELFDSAQRFKQAEVRRLRDLGCDVRLAIDDDPRNISMFLDMGIAAIYENSGYH